MGRWHRTWCYSCFHRHASKASPSTQRPEEEGDLNYGSPCNSEGVFLCCWGGVGAPAWRPASSGPLNHPTCAPSSLRKTSLMVEDNTQLQLVLSVSSVYLSNYSISPATLLFFILCSAPVTLECLFMCAVEIFPRL